jgi:hypothetical protein
VPEQRLQKCRAAYDSGVSTDANKLPVLTERDRADAAIEAIRRGWRPWHGGLPERRASAAYRITQAQQVADAKKAES